MCERLVGWTLDGGSGPVCDGDWRAKVNNDSGFPRDARQTPELFSAVSSQHEAEAA